MCEGVHYILKNWTLSWNLYTESNDSNLSVKFRRRLIYLACAHVKRVIFCVAFFKVNLGAVCPSAMDVATVTDDVENSIFLWYDTVMLWRDEAQFKKKIEIH